LKEYERLHQLTLIEIESSERRVNMFLAITSAAIAGMVVLFQTPEFSDNTNTILPLILIVNFILFLFGLTMLNYINKKNRQLIFLRDCRNKIRQILESQDGALKDYTRFLQKETAESTGIRGRIKKLITSGASFNSFVIFINRVLLGGIVITSMLLLNYPIKISLIIGFLFFFLSRFLLTLYSKFLRRFYNLYPY